jgi:glycosyltransferase involved in cell wall biosynthesis
VTLPRRLDLVVPVLNEAHVLPRTVPRVWSFVQQHMPDWDVVITIADNGSTDGSADVAARLSEDITGVRWWTTQERGRGAALKRAWLQSDRDVLAYVDVDLSSGLDALPTLVERVHEGFDVAIGSRLLPASQVERRLYREVLSRGYSALIRSLFSPGFRDAQCGFKALSRSAAQALLPAVRDGGWFFDTELLLVARAAGMRVAEIPVSWVEDTDSRVRILPTVVADLQGLARMKFGGAEAAAQRVRGAAEG